MKKGRNYWKYGLCIAGGAAFFLLAEFVSGAEGGLHGDRLRRNPPGGGDAVYHLYVSGVQEGEISVELPVPEQKIPETERKHAVSEAVELLCERILGENSSLSDVRNDLNLMREIAEYGLYVEWESEKPDRVSSMGLVRTDGCAEAGETVYLRAALGNGLWEEHIQIPVTVRPAVRTGGARLMDWLVACVEKEPDSAAAPLPKEYEGAALTYREKRQGGNEILLLLGAAAAACLYLREKGVEKRKEKARENFLLLDYSEMISKFLVLLGAGYPLKAAWKRLAGEVRNERSATVHPVYSEMKIALNQMETGVPEAKAYADFGRRCGLRCYVRFAALLGNNLKTGNKNLRSLLEDEMEEAFNQRKDYAKKLGEEAAAKLLLPLFLMLAVVMIMVVSPAFMSMG